MVKPNRMASVLQLVLVAVLLVACATPAQPAPSASSAQQPAAAAPTTAPAAPGGANKPTQVKICIGLNHLDEAWATALIQSMERVKAAQPHGLAMSYSIQDNVDMPAAERVGRQMAESKACDIVWLHSDYFDAVTKLAAEFPDLPFVAVGAGSAPSKPMGPNAYYLDVSGIEAAYLVGFLAGALTKTNTIGAVAEYPYPTMNEMMNAYADGARSANPKVKVVGSYIQSWFDPPKAAEAATAQISAGADMIYSMPIGPIEACQKANVMCFGHYVDQNSLGPKVVLTSSLIKWDPHITFVIDAWWQHKVDGRAYSASPKALMYMMAQGGVDIAPFHDLDSAVPQDAKQRLADAKQQIMDGKLVVKANQAEFKSQ